jgi:hypothetical protein
MRLQLGIREEQDGGSLKKLSLYPVDVNLENLVGMLSLETSYCNSDCKSRVSFKGRFN